MSPEFEGIALRIYFHCGWAITVDPSFESESVEGGETLRMFNEDESREVYLSSMKFIPTDGRTFKAEDVLSLIPPREFQGQHFEHEAEGVKGRALWMLGEDDTQDQPSWVLMSFVVAEAECKGARCTIVCDEESDMDWALTVWRSVIRAEAPPTARP